MVTTVVRALIDGVTNDGKKYAKGDEFPMEISLVKPHVAAGQVEIVAGSQEPVASKKKK